MAKAEIKKRPQGQQRTLKRLVGRWETEDRDSAAVFEIALCGVYAFHSVPV